MRYLSLLEARNYAESTLKAIISALKKLTGHLPDSRKAALADDLAQTVLVQKLTVEKRTPLMWTIQAASTANHICRIGAPG